MGMPTSFAVGHVNVFAAKAVPWDSQIIEQPATTKPASFLETGEANIIAPLESASAPLDFC
jgi:hypothetical protein